MEERVYVIRLVRIRSVNVSLYVSPMAICSPLFFSIRTLPSSAVIFLKGTM